MWIFRLLVRRAVLPDDSPDTAVRKKLVIVYAPVVLGSVLGGVQQSIYPVSLICCFFFLATSLGFLFVFLMVTRRMPQGLLEAGMVVCSFASLIGDWGAAAGVGYIRVWPGIVIVMDVLLTIGAKRWVQSICLYSTAAWLAVSAVEDSYRLGLYDIDGWSEQPADVQEERIQCGNLPCAAGPAGGLVKFTFYTCCLFVDFFATRGFAEGQRREQERVQAMVAIAEQVALLLAAYKVEEAELVTAEHGGALPPDFRAAFELQLANLKSYRPYLPDSLLARNAPEAESASSQAMPSVAATSRGSTTTSESGLLSSCLDVPAGRSLFGHNDAPEVKAAPQQLRRLPQARKAVMLMRNSNGLLATAVRADSAAIGAWLAAEVESFSATVRGRGGVTDLLSGDHLSASFGAVAVQGMAKTNGVSAAVQIAAPGALEGELGLLQTTTAVCTGRALCGDFGSATAQRFMVIGGVSSFIVAVERAGAAWGARTLIDAAVHADVHHLWNCRLRKQVLFPKLTLKPIGLWEVVDARKTGQGDEWMYELQEAEPNPWTVYSAAVAKWCERGAEGALSVIAAEGATVPDGSEAGRGLRALKQEVRAGAPAPVGPLSAAALAGSPAPLEPPDPLEPLDEDPATPRAAIAS